MTVKFTYFSSILEAYQLIIRWMTTCSCIYRQFMTFIHVSDQTGSKEQVAHRIVSASISEMHSAGRVPRGMRFI